MRKHTKLDWGRMLGHLSPYNLKKAALYLRHFGVKGFLAKLNDRFEYSEISYEQWRSENLPTQEELERQRRWKPKEKKRYSIVVPLYRTPEKFLRRMIESVQEQTYGEWELCLADASPRGEKKEETELTAVIREYQKTDGRIKYCILESNAGISANTNRAVKMASGDYLCFLDHDDFLAPEALYEFAAAAQRKPQAGVFYSDEDKVSADGTEYFQPHFKPDFNQDLLRSNNYICHFLCVDRKLAQRAGLFDEAFDGAQDYDFIFRCTELAKEIVHVPKVLYHWRVHSSSTSDNPFSKDYAYEAGRRAIEAHLDRCGLKGRVERRREPGFYRVIYETQGRPSVSVVIPNKDHREDLDQCLKSLWDKTTYPKYEIIVVENNSTEPETFAYYKAAEQEAARRGKTLKIVRWPGSGFNYPQINNFGVEKAGGEYIVLLNNDVTVITEGWIEEFLSVCQRPGTGAAGARLYYPDNTIQHAGIIIGIGGVAGSLFTGMPAAQSGYMNKAALLQDLSAVTAACMMVKKSVYEEVGGMDAAFSVAFNDVDLCLRIREKGYLVVYDPYVEMYHHESKTRGTEDTKEKIRRFQSEIELMRSRWIKILKEGDPYYNPNFSLKTWKYELKH